MYMHLPLRLKRKKGWKDVVLGLLAVVGVVYVLWVTSGFVSAFLQNKHVYVFPTQVTANGWSNGESAFSQELSAQAPYASFSQSNSAYVLIASSTPAQSSPASGGTGTVVPFPENVLQGAGIPIATSSAPSIPTATSTVSTPSAVHIESAETPLLLEVPTINFPISTTPQPIAPLPVPSTAGASSTSRQSEGVPTVADGFRAFGSTIFSLLFPKVLATTTGADSNVSSTTPVNTQIPASSPRIIDPKPAPTPALSALAVATCTVLTATCHVLEFKGFEVSGALKDKEFKKAEIKFSFAQLAHEGGTLDGKLAVRYFHNGRWKSAGEIYLNQEISNATNGGYFAQTLDDVTSWDDLRDIHVAFEYVPGDGSGPVQLYLDSVWIDTVYVEQVQDILSGNVSDPSDVPQNVSFDLAKGSLDSNVLILNTGESVTFPYLDSLTNTLALRVDRSVYRSNGSSTVVYTSITNTKKDADTMRLYISFPGGKGTVDEVSQYLRNVPRMATSTQRSDVTYFCPEGWAFATTSAKFTCSTTGENYPCSSLNDTKNNCQVNNTPVGVSTTTSYVSTWVATDLTVAPKSDKEVDKNLPPGYVAQYATAKTFSILPGQTLYFKATLTMPDTYAKRFVLSAKGESYFGSVDSLHLRDENYIASQGTVKKAKHPSDGINEQISDKSDFNVDELPKFHFKFKTQRDFFTRVKDFMLGRTVAYKVQNAQLRHAKGEIQHLPVTIEYGANNEWSLQLQKQPRDFRPGKYSLDLAMNENSGTYTDTVNFYWGILALNPDKSSYEPGSIAHLSIAALDDLGDTMCDAQLALTVTDPSGGVSDVPIVSGGGCGHNNITTLPDFIADYPVHEEGVYTAVLSRLDDSGAIVTSATETFLGQKNAPYLVTRDGPTRIFPSSAYQMHISVAAREGFTGTIVETLPEGFTVSATNGGVVTRADGVVYLTWNVSLSGTSAKDLTYIFKAPEVSPYMYLLGPLQFRDDTGVVFKEPNTWKIASDATSIATGVAWLGGNATTNSSNLSSTTAYALAWNLSDDYDTTYFSHSTSTNNSQLVVNVAGDYLVAVTVPTERADTTGTRTVLEADVRVNGGKQNVGVGRSYIKTANSVNESSSHLYVLLKGLRVGDYIESYVHNLTTATDNISIATQASMYAEYIGSDQNAYFGFGTTTTLGTNLNSAATSTIVWYDNTTLGRKDSNYTHNNSSASTTIALAASGDYMVFINIPLNGAVSNGSVLGKLFINGVLVPGGNLKQGYIENTGGDTDSSLQWSGVVHATTTNEKISVTVIQDAVAGTLTVNNDTASIYIQQLPTSGVYVGRGTTVIGGTDWNPAAADSVQWVNDDIKDSAMYSHSTTTNSHQITVSSAGDYLVALNDSHFSGNKNTNEITSISVNGTVKTGAQTKTHYIQHANGNATTHKASSGSLVYLLRNLAVNDVVTITTVAEATAGAVTEDQDAIVMLWHKSAQSSFVQDTQRWYTNVNGIPPTDPWPSGSVDLNQGDAITTGNATKSGDVLRLRMALKANVTTLAGADSFKLQYAPGSSCTLALAWTDVGAIGSASVWRGYDNAAVTAGATLSSVVLTVSSTTETYEEQNPSAATANSITANTYGEWDWTLQNNGASVGIDYCFRMVHSSGQVLKDYIFYPQLITNNTPDTPALTSPFDNEKTPSTTPTFTFSSSDDNGEDIHYEIQISTDSTFATTLIDEDSVTNFSKFTNINNSADKSPFSSGQTIGYVPTVALTNGATYWWRVKAKDPIGTNTYSAYSAAQSITIDTSVTVSTWFQTSQAQFALDTLSQVSATVTNDVQLSDINTSGTIYSPTIAYAMHTSGNSWGAVSWTNTQLGGTIVYRVEYFTSTSSWAVIPDSALTGNAAGTTTSPISLTQLDFATYSLVRVRGDFAKTSATPILSDWTVSWALSVNQPTLRTLFNNEKSATSTPTITFTTTDPQSDRLVYQVQWSTDSTFVSGVITRTSDTDAGFSNASTTSDTSPFLSGNTISFKVQAADILANNTTYWWRIRAKDPSGGNAYSLWATARSFTVDTSVVASTWFQSTSDQFTSDTLTRTGASGGSVTATSTTGNIAMYRAATAGEAITTAVFNNGWNTTLRQDSIFTLSGTTTIVLKSGHYAVMYGLQFTSTGGTNRSEIQTNLNLAGVNLSTGWSQGFIRRTSGANEGFNSGGGIIKAATDNTNLIVQSFRTDTNASGVQRMNNVSGLQLMKLDDSWSYVRLSKATKQTGPVSSSWLPVTYDRQDEIDTTAYGHTSGGSSVTLKAAGHYLVFANTYGSLRTNNSSVVDQKFKLDNSDIEGSFSTVFMNGNSNADGTYQGAATMGMIIQSTTTNQVLTVQIARSAGTAAWTINGNSIGAYVDRTGLTIVKLPEADFIRLQNSTNPNMNPTLLTPLTWDTEAEKDSSFTHSTTTNSNRITANTAGDYLFLGALYAAPGTMALTEFNQGWLVNGSTLLTYGQTGGYSNTALTDVGNFSANIFPSAISTDFFEMVSQALGSTTGSMPATKKGVQGVRIGSLNEADTNAKKVQSSDIAFSSGTGPKWSTFSWSDTRPASTNIVYQVLYLTASSTYALIPDAALPGNATGFSTTSSSVDLSAVSRTTYSTLRTQATFTCASGNCPSLNDWTVTWAQGINVSGTAKAFDQTTNVTSGTVSVAVNSVLQAGKTATISGGVWTIPNVTVFQNDIVTVFVSSASTSTRAVAVTKYTGTSDITGVSLFQLHLSLGSNDNPTLTNTDISSYDNTVSGNIAIFNAVAGGNLTVCAIANCSTARLLIKSGTLFEPGVSGGNVTTPNIQIDGTFMADGNTITVSDSWKNNASFIKGTSLVVFSATSGASTIDSTLATSSAAFNLVTFGSGASSAVWTLQSPLYASSTLSINFGTLQNNTFALVLSGSLSVGTSGIYTHGTGATNFIGSGTSNWTDSSAVKQDMGDVVVDGAAKTIQLGASVKGTNITIGADDTLNASASNYGITVSGNWTNNNSFVAQAGTVTFTSTATGKTIAAGASSFYNLTFNGVGGNWAFSGSNVSVGNDFTVATGTVTLPTGTTTIAGSFDASTGTFIHNNGAVLLTTASSKTINPGTASFYDLAFNGAGSWTFSGTNATSSRNFTIAAGSVTLPSGVLAVGGAFAKNGGSFSHNNGTLKLTASSVQTLTLGGSSAYTLLFAGSGSWVWNDINATSSSNVAFQAGTVTLPSGTTAIGGSLLNTGGAFTSNLGTVRMTAASTGFLVTPGASSFYNLTFDSIIGGWTVTGNATTTNNLTLTNAAAFTQSTGTTFSVGGTFTNSVGGAATTFATSTLSLSSGTSYSINTKSAGGDVYGTLLLSASTNIRMWNSSAATTTYNVTASLYSQNHAGVSGVLNIYGAFTSTANEYWSYSNDFDGTVLAGISQRQVQVNIASSSSVIFAGGLAKIVGTSTASTTIQNQGTGAYAMSVTSGTLQAQYYTINNTNASGLSLSGTTTVTSLSNGSFTLSQSGATTLSVSSSVINQNPLMQIQQVRFATSSGVTSGFNVTETGTPTSYWWFRNHYGNLAGEASNNDPGGNPGYIRWDDSGYNITVSGHVYADHGVTNIGNPPCDGSTAAVTILVGSTTYSGSCGLLTSTYGIPNVQFTGDAVMAVYLNTNGGKRAVTVTKTATANISDLDLYQNSLIVRHEGATPITITDLATFDSSRDSDIFFTASSTAGTLVTLPDIELYVWGGKTFTPGGNVTLQSGGSGSALDGRLYMAANATFTATGAQSHSIGGGITLLSGALFTPANSTLTLTATTTGKSITSASALSLYNLTFSGVGGQWSLDSGVGITTTVQNALTLTAGTLVGTGDMTVQSGNVTGSSTIAMTGGTFLISSTGNFGSSNAWQFKNLTFGNGVQTNVTTKTGAGTTTVSGVLTVAANQTLNASASPWVLTAGGTPFVISGIFNVQSAPFTYSATTATNIANANYAALTLAPSAAGSPTYTLGGGTPTIGSLTIGNGTNPVTVTADTNDPSIALAGTMTISANATYIASNVGALTAAKSWLNSGTFTHSNAAVVFNATTTGNIVQSGNSSFYDVSFNSASGGWTIPSNATSTHDTSIISASSFTLSPNATLSVGGTFINSVGGATTTFASSTLSLTSGTSYTLNTKTAGGDVYGTLVVGASTIIRMWNSSAATTTVNATASLYSQNHAAVSGALNVYGAYTRSSGNEYWSYGTDFDGTDISGSPRKVNVSIASSSTLVFSGGSLSIVGAATASTTIQNQGTGAYALSVSGGTVNAQYYEFRNLDTNGLSLSGAPTVTSLSNGDFRLGVAGGTLLKVAGTVIDANPLKIIKTVSFATTTAITGFNVTETGTSASSWKFNLHYGNLSGEAFDLDPAGDPGYVRWDNSASQITISGRVYSDEGSTVSTVCDNTTQNVKLVVEGTTSFTSSCNSSTGLFSIAGISFNPGDTLTLYLDTNGGKRAANVSVDPISNISNMDLYENRVIVRHEDVNPITIAAISQYTSVGDSDIPITTTLGAPDTLTLPPNTKLIVWDAKTFAPGGTVTVQSGGGANAYDGSLEVRPSAAFVAAGTQAHSIGGNLTFDLGATLTSANSTFTFTATTTGKTITVPNVSTFYNMTFNGVGGNWAFASSTATTTNDVTITNGTVTLPTGTLTVGGSFNNTGGTVVHNNGTLSLTATSGGKTIRLGTSSLYNITLNGSGGSWTFVDTNATTSNTVTVTAGSVTLPAGVLAVGNSFLNSGVFTHNSGTVKMTATATGKSVQAGGSSFGAITFSGIGGGWTFLDASATTTSDFTLTSGTVVLPVNTLAIGGSFINSGTFTTATNTVKFIATATGKTVTPGASSFYNLTFDSIIGGWTVTGNATTTNNLTLTNAAAFTQSTGTTFSVGGTFTNSVGGAATTFATSTLSLSSGTSYSINTKSAGGDVYGTLLLSASTNIRMWNSSAATTTYNVTASLYSQNHAGVSGVLNIYGAYTRSTGNDYWSYATDFDGTALGAFGRQVSVQIASSSSVALSGGTLAIVGGVSATTTIANQGAGAYSLSVSGGTLNASYYQIRNTDANGLFLSGTPVISSLGYGDFLLAQSGASMITVAGSVIDANSSFHIIGNKFASSSGVTSGFNVKQTGAPISAWTFTQHYGNYAGEAFDSDGADACGNLRWDDSACLFVNQAHYRWRNDDGGEGALATEWYNTGWSSRKKVAISNPNATAYTNYPVKVTVLYDASMKTDFSDLRFTDSTGTALIPYFIESSVASASSTVWINVPSLPASGSATVYMYYGNAAAADASDGSGTFTFYDSFENNNLTGYSGDTATKFNTGVSFARVGTYGVDAGVHVNEKTVNGMYRTGTQTAQGKTIRFFQYVDAAQSDEPCTLFGVQSAGNNYALCLDEYPSQTIEIVKNVTSNDGSGTVLASTTVTYTTGWYEVSIDWLTTNAINVTVYGPSGSVFATLSTTDSSYTSGGMGFSYWFQHGGWDYYTTRAYAAAAPTAIMGVKQMNNGATWVAGEDTAYGTLPTGSNIRLRMSVQNTGVALVNQSFRLQLAPKGAALNCESVPYVNYNDVPVAGSCGSAAACMTSSSQFTNLASTSGLLSYPASMNFSAGEMMQNTSNQTNGIPLASNAATEVEYNFQMTNNATSNTYCFRTSKGGVDLDSYDRVAEATILHAPFLTNISLNAATSIALTEGTSTNIYITASTTDLNGYADMVSATSTLYRSSLGSSCNSSLSSCYQIASTSCAFSNCSGNSCSLTCTAPVEYFADPTDIGSVYAADNWLSRIAVQDSTGLRDTQASFGVELLTLHGLALQTASINFGTLSAGQNTGSTNATTTINNTGNALIDIQLLGTDMASGGSTIAVGQQQYATTTFSYGSCALCQYLSGSATNVTIGIPKTSSTSTPTTGNVYWGINVPTGTGAASFTGTNTFIATGG